MVLCATLLLFSDFPAIYTHANFFVVFCDRFVADGGSSLLQVVEGELKTESGVKDRQLQLLSSIISDVSETNKQLLTKLNCTTKCNSEVTLNVNRETFDVKIFFDDIMNIKSFANRQSQVQCGKF